MSTHTRPDNTFWENILDLFVERQHQVHRSAEKRVLRYLVGISRQEKMIGDLQGEEPWSGKNHIRAICVY